MVPSLPLLMWMHVPVNPVASMKLLNPEKPRSVSRTTGQSACTVEFCHAQTSPDAPTERFSRGSVPTRNVATRADGVVGVRPSR